MDDRKPNLAEMRRALEVAHEIALRSQDPMGGIALEALTIALDVIVGKQHFPTATLYKLIERLSSQEKEPEPNG